MTAADLRAAGALVWRVHHGKLQVLLVHRPRYDDWSWPKGKPEGTEALPVTAVREVEEETGLRVALGQPLPSVRYELRGGRVKETHYWAAAAHPRLAADWEAGRAPVEAASSDEIDSTKWVSVKKAAKLLTYERDRAPLGALMDAWDDSRLDTWAVLVVRHARARSRAAWKQGEETRPLTDVGRRQAALLAPILSAYGVTHLLSSPWERCTATLAPYAAATGLELRPVEGLAEAAAAADPDPARRAVEFELRDPTRTVAICTHRPVLPEAIGQVLRHTPNRIARQLPQTDPWLKTSETLVAHLAAHPTKGGIVVALEKVRPYSL